MSVLSVWFFDPFRSPCTQRCIIWHELNWWYWVYSVVEHFITTETSTAATTYSRQRVIQRANFLIFMCYTGMGGPIKYTNSAQPKVIDVENDWREFLTCEVTGLFVLERMNENSILWRCIAGRITILSKQNNEQIMNKGFNFLNQFRVMYHMSFN